jgi:hypothetical protein
MGGGGVLPPPPLSTGWLGRNHCNKTTWFQDERRTRNLAITFLPENLNI